MVTAFRVGRGRPPGAARRNGRGLVVVGQGPCGFTLIEAAVVLLLLGVLSVYAINRMGSSGVAAIAEADALRAALRYAQSRAMADIYTWGISLSSNGYTLVEDNPNIGTPPLPGQGSSSRSMPDGVTLGGNTSLVLFDWRGQPVSGHITTIGGTASAVTGYQGITVMESSTTESVVITPYTGFVP